VTGDGSVIVDAAERDRIERSGLHETLFVEAGAGTGKTHELVQRVVHLVLDDGIPLSAIAAITFTEAAAAELRDRIREAFERRLAADPAPVEEQACRSALGEVDEAAISTLHGFACGSWASTRSTWGCPLASRSSTRSRRSWRSRGAGDASSTASTTTPRPRRWSSGHGPSGSRSRSR
jgi:hypothetical protein